MINSFKTKIVVESPIRLVPTGILELDRLLGGGIQRSSQLFILGNRMLFKLIGKIIDNVAIKTSYKISVHKDAPTVGLYTIFEDNSASIQDITKENIATIDKPRNNEIQIFGFVTSFSAPSYPLLKKFNKVIEINNGSITLFNSQLDIERQIQYHD